MNIESAYFFTILPSGIYIAVPSLILGIVFTFFGNRAFKFLLILTGFIAGFIVGMEVAAAFTKETTYLLIVAVVSGALLGTLLFFAYYFGVFVIGAITGLAIVFSFDALISRFILLEGYKYLIFAGSIAIIFGVFAIFFQFIMIKILTAIVGATLIVNSLIFLFLIATQKVTSLKGYFEFILVNPLLMNIALIFITIIAVSGLYYQFSAKNY